MARILVGAFVTVESIVADGIAGGQFARGSGRSAGSHEREASGE